MRGAFANTGMLTAFALKRESRPAALWILLLGLAVVGLAPVMHFAYGDSLENLLSIVEMPAMIGMMGPAFAAGHEGFGPMYTTFMLLFASIAVAIMNIFLVARHTRADEEKGRFEVLRSLPVGAASGLGAALLAAAAVNLLLGIAVAGGLLAVGISGMGLAGSLLWGASLAAVGLAFAGFSALFCQLSPSSRGAIGYSFALMGLFYLMRVPGDLNPEMELLSLISPLGLALRAQPYMANQWWPVFGLLAFFTASAGLAFFFNMRRDIEQGVLPARRGPATGGLLMKGIPGLAFRLLRPGMAAWLVGMFLLSASYGSVVDGLDDFLAGNEMYQMLILGPVGISVENFQAMPPEARVEMMREMVGTLGYTMTELFASMVNSMMGIIAIVPVVLIALRAKGEEESARSEIVLAAPVARGQYLAWYAAAAFVMAALVQLALALGFYSVARGVVADPAELGFGFVLASNMVYVPALWAMAGVALFLYGLRPRLAGLVWGYFAYIFVIVFFGRMDVFPNFLSYLTPFGFVPDLPAEEVSALPLVALSAVGAGLGWLGVRLYCRRDLNVV